ncbi:sulfotransferase family protein [Formosa maritima]|uniref:Sulfotransferase n=1 Tax=Formosa maritima TaxID=2592046 RepID=A0A5D0FZS9_9FLAO|nr:sulfotransferase [Formosa maritima]TYA52226.1 sulfotransferase [Formosa maritima]
MKHVFITGCPRSGTTMLASMLGSAHYCVATPESDFFIDFIYKYLNKTSKNSNKEDFNFFLKTNYRFKQWHIEPNDIENIPESITYDNYNGVIESTLKLFIECHSDVATNEVTRIDHTPTSILDFNILNDFFPESNFIFIVRDPRAVYASVKNLDWGANTALKLAEEWNEYAAMYFSIKKLFPERVSLVRYEDILKNAPTELKRLCDFIGVPYSSDLNEGSGFKIPSYTSSQHSLVGKTLDKHRIDHWKHKLNHRDILLIESKSNLMMKVFNYDPTHSIKYRIRVRDKVQTLLNETFYYFANKIRKRKREKNA